MQITIPTGVTGDTADVADIATYMRVFANQDKLQAACNIADFSSLKVMVALVEPALRPAAAAIRNPRGDDSTGGGKCLRRVSVKASSCSTPSFLEIRQVEMTISK